eukprot:233311-Chlamydomonas_euryale.AAC.3
MAAHPCMSGLSTGRCIPVPFPAGPQKQNVTPLPHLEDGHAPLHVWSVNRDLTVKTPRPQQRRVEHVGAVGRCQNDDARVALEAVHLCQQLVDRLLALIVATAHARAALAADGVDLVDEHNARRLGLGLVKEVAHARRSDTDKHLDEL